MSTDPLEDSLPSVTDCQAPLDEHRAARGVPADAAPGERGNHRLHRIEERARGFRRCLRLLLPGEMGEIFKVIALGRGVDAPLAGFATQDLCASL